MEHGHGYLRQEPPSGRARRFGLLLLTAGLGVVVAAAAAATLLTLHHSATRPVAHGAARTPAFVARQLGARAAALPTASRPRFRAGSRITPSGFQVHLGGSSVSLASADGARGPWKPYKGGAARPTAYGQQLVTVSRSGAEQLLQVDRHQGTRTWSWRLTSPGLAPSLRKDGTVVFLGAGGKDTGVRITPVDLLNVAGQSVTPKGLAWSLAHRAGADYLQLRLDDSSLPVPYLIDPTAVTGVTFSGSSMVAGASSDWTMAFTTSAAGALNAGKTITVVFSSVALQNFTVPLAPTTAGGTLVLGAAFSSCTATGVGTVATATVVITLAGASCSLPALTATSVTIKGITNSPGAANILANRFSVKTSADTTVVNPASTVNIVPGPFVKLQILMPGEAASAGSASGKTGAPAAHAAGAVFSVTVNAVDANWNKITTVTDTVNYTSNDPQFVPPANPALVLGTVTTNTIKLFTAGVLTQTVTANDFSDGTKTANTSSGSTVTALAVNKLVVTSVPVSATAGVNFTVVVKSTDIYGNPVVAGAATGISLSASGLGVLSGNVGTIVAAGSQVTLNAVQYTKAESITLTATRTSGTVLATSAASSSFTVNPAAAATLTLSGTPASVTAGNTGSVTVTANDAFGNIATGYLGTVTFSSSDIQAALPANYPFVAGDNGVHTFTNLYTLKTVVSQTVTATDTVTPAITGTSGAITVNPATAATLTLSSTPASVTAGTTGSVTVTAKDTYGNTATGYLGTVTFSSNDVQAALPSNYLFLAGDNGVHIFTNLYTLKTAGSQTVTAKDTVTPSITGTSAGITVNPATPTQLSITSVPATATAGLNFSVTVKSLDPYGNVSPVTSATGISLGASGSGTLSGNTATIANATSQVTLASVQYTKAESITLTATATSGMALTASPASSSIAVGPGATTQLIVAAPASTTAGVSVPVTVTAEDAFGNVATGYTDTAGLTSTDAQAVLPGAHTYTGADAGVHTYTVALKTAGSKTVSASDGSINGTSGAIAVNAAAAADFSFTGTPASLSAGSTGSMTLTAVDGYGNKDVGFTGTVTFTSSDPLATLPSAYPFTGADAGVHTFTNLYTLKTTGWRTITGTSGTVDGTSSGITVNPGPATSLAATAPASTTAGAGVVVTVTAKDAFNNIATGYAGSVSFSSTDAQATLPSGYTFVAGDNGSASFSATLKTMPSQTVSVTDGPHNATTGSISVSAGAASSFVVSAPATAAAGSAVSVTVTAKDAFGNTASGYTGTAGLTSTDAQAVLPSAHTFTGAEAGVYTFSPVTLKTAGSQTVSAADGPIAGTSGGISVTPGSLASLAVTAPATATAGTGISVTVSGADAYGNPTTNYTGTVTLTSSDGQAVLPAPHTYTGGDAGTHIFPVTLKTSGSQTVSASDGSISGSSGSSGSVAVSPAAASSLKFSGTPASATAGSGFPLTVTARDPYNNLATGYLGTVSFTSTDPQAALPAPYAFVAGDAGVKVFTVTLKTAGSRTVSISDGSLSDTTSAVAVVPAAAASLTVSGPASAIAGALSSFTVTAFDAYNNIATGYTGTVGLTSTDAQAALPPAHPFVAGDAGVYVFPVTLKTAGSKTVSAADGPLNGTSGPVTVSPAAVSTAASTVTASPASVVADGSTPVNVTVTLLDAYGNVEPGKNVSLAATGSASATPASVATDGSGVAVFSVTDTAVESSTFTATDTSDSLVVTQTAGGSFIAGPLWSIAINPSSSAVAAGASQVYAITGSDAYSHPLGPQVATFSISPDGSCVNALSSCSANLAGPHTVTAMVGTKSAFASLSVAAGPSDAAQTALSALPTSIVADGSSSSTITVTAKDAYGNARGTGGDTVALATTVGTLSAVTDHGNGTYTASLTGLTPGSATVSGTINGSPITATAAVTLTNSDTTPPSLVSATGLAGSLTLGYSELLDPSSTPLPGDFSVMRSLSPDAVTGVTVSGTSVTLTLGTSIVSGDLVTVSYSGTATQDLAANPAPTFLNQPVTTGSPPPVQAACKPPQHISDDGKYCVTPPPPPPVRFLSSSPTNGDALATVDSFTLTANHMTSWYAISLARPDGSTTAINSGSGASFFGPLAATQPGSYTLTATMDDGYNPRQQITIHFLVVPSSPNIALPSKQGSIASTSGKTTVTWPAGTFTEAVHVQVDEGPSLSGSFAKGTHPIKVTVVRLSDGTPVTTFAQPLEIILAGSPAVGVPSFSEDGVNWSPLPALTSDVLPPGQADGFFREPSGVVHVLTRHATFFGVLAIPAATKLALSMTGSVTLLSGGARRISVSVNATKGAQVVATLYSPHGTEVQGWTRTVVPGTTMLTFFLPAGKAQPGIYTIVLEATAGTQVTQSAIPVILR